MLNCRAGANYNRFAQTLPGGRPGPITEKPKKMAARIRLARHGTKKRPFYRIVAASKEKPRDGRFLERLGHYDPTREPAEIRLDLERVEAWIRKGATPTPTVLRLMKKSGWKGLPDAPAAAASEG